MKMITLHDSEGNLVYVMVGKIVGYSVRKTRFAVTTLVECLGDIEYHVTETPLQIEGRIRQAIDF